MAVRAGHIPADAAVLTPPDTLRLHRAALWGLLFSKLLGGWGVQWDIQWHVFIGRDSFWIPPHVMTYAGVSLAVLLSFGVLARDTLSGGPGLRLFALRGTRGWHLAAWGIGLTVLAAPIDDLWHRLFGLDVTLWSPPHMLGMVGSVINTLGCLLICQEVYAAGTRARRVALVLFGAMLYGNLHLMVEPSTPVAYRNGGVWFYTLAILSALILPLALVATARLSALRWAPVLLLLVVVVVNLAGREISWMGFQILQPGSVMEEEIVKDPTSNIAIAYMMSKKTGSAPGRTGGLIHRFALVAALAMALLDARRRPILATLGYAAVLFLVVGWLYSRHPALAPLVPGPGETALALGLTLGAAVIGGWVGRQLGDLLVKPVERLG